MKLFFLLLLALIARLFARPPRSDLKKILVIKPDALGDALLATPALRRLRAGLPDAQITGVVGPWSRVIWARNPDLDLLLDLPFPGFNRASDPNPDLPRPRRRLAAALRPYWLLLRYAALLRRGEYDAALLLRDDHWWGAALAALAGIPRRVGHAHPLCAPFLSDALPYDPAEHVSRQGLAVVARLLDAERLPNEIVEPSGIKLPLRFELSPNDHAWAEAWMTGQISPGEKLLVIHPGTGGPTKHWLPERWASIADALASRHHVHVLFTGGLGEADLVDHICGMMRNPALRIVGGMSVGQMAALLARATLVLGVDSGPLHLAVSQGVPTIHLYGPSDQRRFGPWGPLEHHMVLRSGIFCSPCGVYNRCPRGMQPIECMATIHVTHVLQAANKLME
ncbi:glycosyltransferase family 9 protein [Chloroflexales bacterium ZM16-3]|nr:glycosyltransferase family 9 protein [Chloroflexales bacterium ZM16-3]